MVAVTRVLFGSALLCLLSLSNCMGPGGSGRIRALVAEGDASLSRGLTDRAIESYRGALDIESRFPPALHGLIRAHLARGDVEASLALCAAMEVGTPAYFQRVRADCTRALELAATERQNRGDPTGELRLLERLSDLAPETQGLMPRLNRVRLAAAESRFRQGQRVEAIALYRELLSTAPDQTRVRVKLAEALGSLGRIEEAVTVLSSGLAEHPGSAELEAAMDRLGPLRSRNTPARISP
ncbi:tetratricopeptide repeat protein [Myxococcota bacterium]|nr:tetratricopeptide repeat protein [Myxococcota bacterium]